SHIQPTSTTLTLIFRNHHPILTCYIYKAKKCCLKYTKHTLLPKKRSTNSVTSRYVDNFIHTFPIDLSIINTKIFDLCTKYTHRHVDNFYLVYPTVSW